MSRVDAQRWGIPTRRNRVRELREAQGVSIRELAARAGLSERTVRYVETATTSPRGRTQRKLLDVLGVSPDHAAQVFL